MAAQIEPLVTTGAAPSAARSPLHRDRNDSPPRPTLARGDEDAVRSPTHALHARIASEYHEPVTGKWPAALRLAVLLGGTGALWVVGVGFVRFLFR